MIGNLAHYRKILPTKLPPIIRQCNAWPPLTAERTPKMYKRVVCWVEGIKRRLTYHDSMRCKRPELLGASPFWIQCGVACMSRYNRAAPWSAARTPPDAAVIQSVCSLNERAAQSMRATRLCIRLCFARPALHAWVPRLFLLGDNQLFY
jgi:hypothetical protein